MFAVVSLSVAFSWGQVPAPRPPTSSQASQPTQPAKPAQPALSDAELETAIRERLAKSKIGANGFQVRVRNGVAILEGRTDVAQHKGTATRLARNAGVRRVDNRIQVSESARRKASAKVRSAPRRVEVRRSEPRQSGSSN
ncbi:MAG: BON domain-containing protein [Bryobacteraceae bacterium]|nr:BON domain-containing protein [Bryobacteraceae bacterium]